MMGADLTECPSCKSEYQDPKLLPCNHTVCLSCLARLEDEKMVTCPTCDVKHSVPERGVKAFTENQHVIQLVADKKVCWVFTMETDLLIDLLISDYSEKTPSVDVYYFKLYICILL